MLSFVMFDQFFFLKLITQNLQIQDSPLILYLFYNKLKNPFNFDRSI